MILDYTDLKNNNVIINNIMKFQEILYHHPFVRYRPALVLGAPHYKIHKYIQLKTQPGATYMHIRVFDKIFSSHHISSVKAIAEPIYFSLLHTASYHV